VLYFLARFEDDHCPQGQDRIGQIYCPEQDVEPGELAAAESPLVGEDEAVDNSNDYYQDVPPQLGLAGRRYNKMSWLMRLHFEFFLLEIVYRRNY